MMKMCSMKHSEQEMNDEEDSVMAEKPEYPYGLEISLQAESLDKLGVKDLPKVGDAFLLAAKAQVCCVMEDDEGQRMVRLQITDLALQAGKAEKSTESKIYS